MTSKVVCKAVVSKGPTTNGLAQVSLSGVHHGSSEAQAQSENAIFGEWTPVFHLSMALKSEEAAAFFIGGEQVYVTFSKERLHD